jgi:hypothetical protein
MLIYLMIFSFSTFIFFRNEIDLFNIFINSMEYILLYAYVPFLNYLYKINLRPCILDIRKNYKLDINNFIENEILIDEKLD